MEQLLPNLWDRPEGVDNQERRRSGTNNEDEYK